MQTNGEPGTMGNITQPLVFVLVSGIILISSIIWILRTDVMRIDIQMAIGLVPKARTDYKLPDTVANNINLFNMELTTKRGQWNRAIKLSNNFTITQPYIVAREHLSDYFQRVSTNHQVLTFALFINKHFNLTGSHIEYSQYKPKHMWFPRESLYPFALEKGACDIFIRKGFSARTVRLIGNNTCEIRSSLKTTSIPFNEYSANEFEQEYKQLLDFWEQFYIHFIPNARISLLGLVAQGNLIIEPLACAPGKNFTDLEHLTSNLWLQTSKHVDEVFVSVHKVADSYFHWNVEAISRIVIYLDFLQANPDVKILIPSKNGAMMKRYLTILGIPNDRLVWGKVTTRIAYLPQGSRCGGKASGIGLSIAANIYLNHVETKLQENSNPDTIILIHRTKKRWLLQHDAIKQFLAQLAKKYKMRFVVFSDKNLPSFENTMRLFYRAALIVAPHGAGMVNAMFSRPGTVVIEIMCPIPNAVLCYPYLMRNLGHVYYGIRHDKFKNEKSCQRMWVDLNRLKAAVNFYITGHVMPRIHRLNNT